MNAPILVHPDPNHVYVLYTDSSNHCIDFILTQWIEEEECEISIYFLSHKLSNTQRRWSVVEE